MTVQCRMHLIMDECQTTMQILKFKKKPAQVLPTQTEYAFTNMNGNI